ncbi:hypothetical protein [Streptomyces griseoaurantiacus]|uniref:hypothetical protein n=1 Tax=Streptomyces griseoaurantiacus TaxID=68213 RepID=UPI0036B7FADA
MSGEHSTEDATESRHESPKSKRMPGRAYVMAAAFLTAGIFLGFSIAAESVPPAPMPGGQAGLQEPTPTTIPGEGMWRVGTGSDADVRPGLYQSSHNILDCSWRRSRDASGEHRAIISGDVSRGTAYAQLQSGEFFDTAHCATWHRVGAPSSGHGKG